MDNSRGIVVRRNTYLTPESGDLLVVNSNLGSVSHGVKSKMAATSHVGFQCLRQSGDKVKSLCTKSRNPPGLTC